MAARKDTPPSVATYADHEVITPAHALNKAIVPASKEDDDPVARAEAALAQLSKEFAEWMHAECERLESARQEVVRQGFTEKTHGELFRAAHDIKGEAATFGYPAVVGVAESLCRLLEHTPDWSRIPLTLVEQHVDAVRAIAANIPAPILHPSPARSPGGYAKSPTNSCATKTPIGRTIWKTSSRRSLRLSGFATLVIASVAKQSSPSARNSGLLRSPRSSQ